MPHKLRATEKYVTTHSQITNTPKTDDEKTSHSRTPEQLQTYGRLVPCFTKFDFNGKRSLTLFIQTTNTFN